MARPPVTCLDMGADPFPYPLSTALDVSAIEGLSCGTIEADILSGYGEEMIVPDMER